ncbi:MAG: hypothetical protein WDN28_12150 [Chthoniobacter sp.]
MRETTRDAANGPVAPAQNPSLLVKTGDFFGSQSKRAVFVECVLLIAIIGYVDYFTTYQWTMSIFYAIPILLTVWHGPRKTGVSLALLSTVVWYGANFYQHPHLSDSAYLWIAFNRMALLSFRGHRGRRDEEPAR